MFVKRKMQAIIENQLFKGKVIVLYGARQVGKTTLTKNILSKQTDGIYINCEEPEAQSALTNRSSQDMK